MSFFLSPSRLAFFIYIIFAIKSYFLYNSDVQGRMLSQAKKFMHERRLAATSIIAQTVLLFLNELLNDDAFDFTFFISVNRYLSDLLTHGARE